MVFLVQMRQSNKCGKVRNDEVINLALGFGAGQDAVTGMQLPLAENSECQFEQLVWPLHIFLMFCTFPTWTATLTWWEKAYMFVQ